MKAGGDVTRDNNLCYPSHSEKGPEDKETPAPIDWALTLCLWPHALPEALAHPGISPKPSLEDGSLETAEAQGQVLPLPVSLRPGQDIAQAPVESNEELWSKKSPWTAPT